MTALFIVVPLALLVSALAVGAFIWSVRHGQLDDLETPALRMLEDDQERGDGSTKRATTKRAKRRAH